MFFSCKNIVRTSIYIIALLLSVLVLVSCSKLQSGVTSFSEKVKETFHTGKKQPSRLAILICEKNHPLKVAS